MAQVHNTREQQQQGAAAPPEACDLGGTFTVCLSFSFSRRCSLRAWQKGLCKGFVPKRGWCLDRAASWIRLGLPMVACIAVTVRDGP